MKKVTQKEIRSYITEGIAVDLKVWSRNAIRARQIAEGGFTDVLYSSGACGINGVLAQGYCTGALYAVVGRCSELFMIL